MRLLACAALGLAVVAFAATSSASALAPRQDARNCNLCLESAARETLCENNNPSQPGFDFDCLCGGPGYSEVTRGCANFCIGTEYGVPSLCSADHKPAKRDAQSCTLCLEQAARQTHCENNDPSKTGFDFDCLCYGPGYVDVTKGCANFCKNTKYESDSQCLKTDKVAENDVAENDVAENDVAENDVAENDVAENDVAEKDAALTTRGPNSCAICLQEAETKTGCAHDSPEASFNFGCLCQEPAYETTRDCSLFCADTALNIDTQCTIPASAERAVSVGSPRECTLCLEAASAKTSCADPSTPGFDFDCLCQASLFDEVVGCTAFCNGTPNDLHSQCPSSLSFNSSSAPPALPPRNISPTETTESPHFGFCGPKGVNCKSTEHALSAAAQPITKTTDALPKRHQTLITKTTDNLAPAASDPRNLFALPRGWNTTATTAAGHVAHHPTTAPPAPATATGGPPTSVVINGTTVWAASRATGELTMPMQSVLPVPPVSDEPSEDGSAINTISTKSTVALVLGLALAFLV